MKFTGWKILLCAWALIIFLYSPFYLFGAEVAPSTPTCAVELQTERNIHRPEAGQFTKLTIQANRHQRFEIINNHPGEITSQKILYLLLVQDEKSWGMTSKTQRRSFEEYLDLLKGQEYPSSATSLGVLVSDEKEYSLIKEIAQRRAAELNYIKITIIYQPVESVGNMISREERHKPTLQRERRSNIAKLRNILMSVCQDDEYGILWLDADIFKIDAGLVKKMVDNGDHKPIITASCRLGKSDDYDLNAWRGNRTIPNKEEKEKLKNGGFYEPRDKKGEMSHVKDMRGEDEFTPLDSVGGTILFIRRILLLQGVIFPPLYIIGTEWDMIQGYDGIETEGLCYLARSIGYTCWALPNSYVEHTAFKDKKNKK